MAAIRIIPLSDDDTERLKAAHQTLFAKRGQRFTRTVPGNCILPKSYENVVDRHRNWLVRPEDVYIMAFPRSGSSWVQELVWCLQNNFNVDKANEIYSFIRIPVLEVPALIDVMKDTVNYPVNTHYEGIEKMDSPRVMKTHLPYCHFPDDLLDRSRVVTCLRNPKDTVVSLFHHNIMFNYCNYEGDFPTFFDLFMDNLLIYTPYFEYTVEAWKRRNHPNMCILFYEEMKADLETNIKRVAKFLDKEVSCEQMQVLLNHLSFKKMKENKALNHEDFKNGKIMKKEGSFIRKGEVGDWKNYFTDEMNKRMDEAIERFLKPVGLEFRYE